MKSRGLKQQLALLREAGVASCAFHPNGGLATVEFTRAGPPTTGKAAGASSAPRGEAIAAARARVAGELDMAPEALEALLEQIPDLGGVS